MSIGQRARQRGAAQLALLLGLATVATGVGTFVPAPVLYAAGTVERVTVSQAGYSAGDTKLAYVLADNKLSDLSFQVKQGGTTVATGQLRDEGRTWGKQVYVANFSSVSLTGSGFSVVSNGVSSYSFPIGANQWESYLDEMTAFYRIQRATATADAYPAGYSTVAPSAKVFHEAGHLDDASSPDRTEHYDLTGGWYDAGDYGKYGGNQWVAGSIALSYLRHASSPSVQYDNDGNGVPDLVDEARFGSEYLLKFVDAFGGAQYNLKNNATFMHPEWSTDNIPGTSDDRIYQDLSVGGSAKAAGALAATARAINAALAYGRIDSALAADFEAFSEEAEAGAVISYEFAAANIDGPHGSYASVGGTANPLLWAETELFLLTNDTAYRDAAEARVALLAPGDLLSTNYWDMRPLALAELYPAASSSAQPAIKALLDEQKNFFLSSANDTPYGVLNQFKNFGVNEPHASYLGDMLRYFELFGDPVVLRAVQRGLYWIFGDNPWNVSWVSGIGTDYVDYLHTRLDTEARSAANPGVVIPGAMVSGPNMKDTKDKKSASPWYEDRKLIDDDTNQWRYNEYSVSIQAGLLYTIAGMSALNGSSWADGEDPQDIEIGTPVIGDFVTGEVSVFARPEGKVEQVEYKVDGGVYVPMSVSKGVYEGAVDTSSLAPYVNKRVDVRTTDSAGVRSYSSTFFTVAPPLPSPDSPLLYDDFGGSGTWGGVGLDWVNWWNQAGGTGFYQKTTADGRTVGLFKQTPASTSSWAKFEPWHDRVDLSGYRYLKFAMKNPGYPDSRVRIELNDGVRSYGLSGGWLDVPQTWTDYQFDMDAFASLGINKSNLSIVIWLKQNSVTYGEMLVDEIKAVNVASGTAPALTEASRTPSYGDGETTFTFQASYSDADNQKPFAVELVMDGVIHRMTETDSSDATFTDGKSYFYSMKLPPGDHRYYYRTTDTLSSVVRTPDLSGPFHADTQDANWKLDEGSGSAAADSFGNGWTAGLEGSVGGGPVWTAAGRFGGALSFDGVDDSASASWGQLTGASERTVAAWFRTTSTADAAFVSWGEDGSASIPPAPGGLSQLGIGGGKLGFFAGGSDAAIALTGYADGQWHHLAAAYDGTKVRLYVDGVLKITKTIALDTASSPLALGRSAGGGSWFAGDLDEIAVYHRALSGPEVEGLASPEPYGVWTLEEGSGSAAVDSSGGGRDGVLYGGPTWTDGGLTFDGIDDYVVIPWGQLSVNASRSIALTFRAASAADAVLAGWGTNSGSALSQLGFKSGSFGFLGNGNTLTIPAAQVADGQWHRAVVAFDKSVMRLFVDGELAAQKTTTLNTGISDLNLGRAPYGASYYKGELGDVRIYDYSVTERGAEALFAQQ